MERGKDFFTILLAWIFAIGKIDPDV